MLFDADDKILLLRRTDEGKKWDIPGGHLKDIEVNRGESGYEDGLEREVVEETVEPSKPTKLDFTYQELMQKVNSKQGTQNN